MRIPVADALEAVFPVESEFLYLDIHRGQTLSKNTTALDLELRVSKGYGTGYTIDAIYLQEVALLPLDAVEPDQERVENYLLALGLCLEHIFKLYDTQAVNHYTGYARGLLAALASGFGNNHPLLLAKAETVEDFIKALETKGRLGKWL